MVRMMTIYGSRCVELKERAADKRRSKRSDQSKERQQIQEPARGTERYGAFHTNTPQHQRGRHGHHGADDKVAEYETANHQAQVRDESSRVCPGTEEAIHSDGHLVLGAEHEKR